MPITLQVKGLNQVIRQLGRPIGPVIQQASLEVGQIVKEELDDYPPPARHPIRWTSRKQQRYYFWMRRHLGSPTQTIRTRTRSRTIGGVRQTRIQYTAALPPYMRYVRGADVTSHNLRGSWSVTRYLTHGARVATQVPYAQFVVGDRQQGFHKNTGWRSAREISAWVARSGMVSQIYGARLAAFLNGGAMPIIGARVA